MELLQKLQSIQLELKVHKGQRNSFGKYNYRSAEDILEAIKPLSEKHNVMFKTSDELKEIGGRVYVETTVKIIDVDNMELQIESKGQAIIDFDAKGMQMPQRTGAASSYAKKYAYGNLLLIDDTKDADATNSHGKDFKKSKPELKGDALAKAIKY
ncbi:MAG: ERF family protein, partial [Prochlorococcus sp.]|nr:ERF family protein [Prochlorococcus sp.]